LQWYLANTPEKWTKGRNFTLRPSPAGTPVLSIQERKRILTDNIFGVDLDHQAVEVTKLSLLLKCLEGESQQSIDNLLLFHERALPDLGDNIKCGNSLIGPDFYDDAKNQALSAEEKSRVNVFDWNKEFGKIMKRGGKNADGNGFDAVIGNPPYLNIDDVWGKGDARQRYLSTHFSEVYRDKTDILFYFLALAVRLSKSHSAFIVSRAFLEAYKADRLRGYLSAKADIQEIM
jgi:hypothetical protein